MSKKSAGTPETGKAAIKAIVQPTSKRAQAASARGIKTTSDFTNLMSELMADLLDGSVTPAVANSTCTAGARLLKAVELQHRYGSPKKSGAQGFVLTGN